MLLVLVPYLLGGEFSRKSPFNSELSDIAIARVSILVQRWITIDGGDNLNLNGLVR